MRQGMQPPGYGEGTLTLAGFPFMCLNMHFEVWSSYCNGKMWNNFNLQNTVRLLDVFFAYFKKKNEGA